MTDSKDYYFNQSITIDNIDYSLTCSPKKSAIVDFICDIIISGNGRSFSYTDNDRDSVNYLEAGIKNLYGMNYQADFINDGLELKIIIKHPVVKPDKIFIFTKNDETITKTDIIEKKIKILETNVLTKNIPITLDMLGPCVNIEHTMDITDIYKIITETIDQYTKLQNKGDIDHLKEFKLYRDDNHLKITNICDISYLYQKDVPIPTKNQLVFHSLLNIGKEPKDFAYRFSNDDCVWTILTKKNQGTKSDNIIGNIEISPDSLNILLYGKYRFNFENKHWINKVNENNNINLYCNNENYLKYCYFLTLPPNIIPDGFYIGKTKPHHYWILIKDNKIYHYDPHNNDYYNYNTDPYKIFTLPSNMTYSEYNYIIHKTPISFR